MTMSISELQELDQLNRQLEPNRFVALLEELKPNGVKFVPTNDIEKRALELTHKVYKSSTGKDR